MSACDRDNLATRHSEACRQGLSRRCRVDWCKCSCHDGFHRAIAGRTGRAQSATSERAAEELARLIEQLTSTGQWFSAATIREFLPPGTSPGQIGAAFAAASRAGLIEPVPGQLHRTGRAAGRSRTLLAWRGRRVVGVQAPPMADLGGGS